MKWLNSVKSYLTNAPVETIKAEIKKHTPEIVQGVTVALLLYLCVKKESKPINLTVNVNNSYPHPYYT